MSRKQYSRVIFTSLLLNLENHKFIQRSFWTSTLTYGVVIGKDGRKVYIFTIINHSSYSTKITILMKTFRMIMLHVQLEIYCRVNRIFSHFMSTLTLWADAFVIYLHCYGTSLEPYSPIAVLLILRPIASGCRYLLINGGWFADIMLVSIKFQSCYSDTKSLAKLWYGKGLSFA